MLSAKQAADILGVTPQQVRLMIKLGQLQAQKLGRDWVISEKALEKAQRERKRPGRPKR